MIFDRLKISYNRVNRMADKILVIISAGDIEKALTGMMYAINAVTHTTG